MVDEEKGKDLEKRMAAVEEYLRTEGVTSLDCFETPLAAEIRKRKEYDARQNAEAEERNQQHLLYMARRRRNKPNKTPIIATAVLCLATTTATILYLMGVIDFPYTSTKEEPKRPRRHVAAPVNPAEQSEIEEVLGQVREQINRDDTTNKGTYRTIIDRPGNISEKYYNAAIVMFGLGNLRNGEEQARSYETASAYLEEALRRNPNVDNTGLRGRLNERLEE